MLHFYSFIEGAKSLFKKCYTFRISLFSSLCFFFFTLTFVFFLGDLKLLNLFLTLSLDYLENVLKVYLFTSLVLEE